MTQSTNRAGTITEPVSAWLSTAEPAAWPSSLDGSQTDQQLQHQAPWQGPRSYAVQTQPWALRFCDRDLEEFFQRRRAAGESKPSRAQWRAYLRAVAFLQAPQALPCTHRGHDQSFLCQHCMAHRVQRITAVESRLCSLALAVAQARVTDSLFDLFQCAVWVAVIVAQAPTTMDKVCPLVCHLQASEPSQLG